MRKQNYALGNPDYRCEGGRQQLVQLHYQHQKALINIKGSLNTFKDFYKFMHNQPFYKTVDEYNEVANSIRKVYTMQKGSIDTSMPESLKIQLGRRRQTLSNLNLSEQQRRPLSKCEKFILQQHLLNIKISQQKIQKIEQRRRNQLFYYQTQPSYFFRKLNLSNIKSQNSVMQNQQQNDIFQDQQKQQQQQQQNEIYESNNILQQDQQLENQQQQIQQPEQQLQQNREGNQIQFSDDNQQNQNSDLRQELYEKLKNNLVEEILQKKFFDEESLIKLFQTTVEEYKSIFEFSQIADLFENIQEQLNEYLQNYQQ